MSVGDISDVIRNSCIFSIFSDVGARGGFKKGRKVKPPLPVRGIVYVHICSWGNVFNAVRRVWFGELDYISGKCLSARERRLEEGNEYLALY